MKKIIEAETVYAKLSKKLRNIFATISDDKNDAVMDMS